VTATAIPHRMANLKLHRGATFGEVSNPPPLTQAVEMSGSGGLRQLSPLDYLTIGGPAHSPRMARGGAHNSASRESHALHRRQAANLIAAARHAQRIGLPFNRMVTIHWEAAGVALPFMAKATGRFLDLLTKAIVRHGGATAWAWVHEGGPGKGGHCHLLAHVPPDLVVVVTRLQKSWLRRITGNPYRARVIRSRPIGGRLGLEASNPDLHGLNLAEALAYVLKGADAAAVAVHDLKRCEPGGLVIGKRCGVSQNIGPKARKAIP